ncbi:MAG: transglycosylase SLT domain-containing protein [Synergistales bacterium]
MPRMKPLCLLFLPFLLVFLAAEFSFREEGIAAAADSFDPAVHGALKQMGCSGRDLLAWGDEIPNSCLFTFWAWPPEKQRQAAAVALHVKRANPSVTPRACWRMGTAFTLASVRFGVPLDLAVAVARAESGFNPAAKSPAGATGVMQVMPGLHHDLLALRFGAPDKWSLVDPEKAILAGSFLLAGYLREEGTLEGALARYLGAADSAYRERVARFRAEAALALAGQPSSFVLPKP